MPLLEGYDDTLEASAHRPLSNPHEVEGPLSEDCKCLDEEYLASPCSQRHRHGSAHPPKTEFLEESPFSAFLLWA